jgi:hypothetical protein
MYPSAVNAVMLVATGPVTRKNRDSWAREDATIVKASRRSSLNVFILLSGVVNTLPTNCPACQSQPPRFRRHQILPSIQQRVKISLSASAPEFCRPDAKAQSFLGLTFNCLGASKVG